MYELGAYAPPSYGPTRFEEQPVWVRKKGRKQLAGRTRAQRLRKKAWWARSAGRSASVPRWATKSAERRRMRKASGGARRGRRGRSTTRRASGYGRFMKARRTTYGPVRFSDQPAWVRSRGRKSKGKRRSAYRTASRRTRRATGARRSRRGLSKREIRQQNRAAWRARKSSRRGRRASTRRSKGRRATTRRVARRSSSRRSLSRQSRRMTYGQVMKQLRGSRMKAWVCAGPKRTGCGGGRRGRRGSRVIGVLRG